ncbi:uncharacterized protein LOC143551141 [Bidens hawaiensis]|uniref:uncharacterized protein LOC143551141 n=1 Tax=Bidens hawaiensis TaxID=980011 RepID=UPI00404A7912
MARNGLIFDFCGQDDESFGVVDLEGERVWIQDEHFSNNFVEVVIRDRLLVDFARDDGLNKETELVLINPNGEDVLTKIHMEDNHDYGVSCRKIIFVMATSFLMLIEDPKFPIQEIPKEFIFQNSLMFNVLPKTVEIHHYKGSSTVELKKHEKTVCLGDGFTDLMSSLKIRPYQRIIFILFQDESKWLVRTPSKKAISIGHRQAFVLYDHNRMNDKLNLSTSLPPFISLISLTMSSSSNKRKYIPSTSKINNHDPNGNLPRKPLSDVSNTPQPNNVQIVHVNPPNTCFLNRYSSPIYHYNPYGQPQIGQLGYFSNNTPVTIFQNNTPSNYVCNSLASSNNRTHTPYEVQRGSFSTSYNGKENLYPYTLPGAYQQYLDLGNQTFQCDSCKACLWEAESRRGKNSSADSNSSLCCRSANVQLPELKQPHESYVKLFRGGDPLSKWKIDKSINIGNAPYTFILSGENYHSKGTLLPLDGKKPQFAQLYIYDTENEVSNQQGVFGQSSLDAKNFDDYIINYLKEILDSQNPLVHAYRMVRDSFKENPQNDLKLRIVGTRKYDARSYNLPTASEVAAHIVGDIGDALDNRDIIVNSRSGGLRRISELHPSYTPLKYPLLYPFGEDGYKIDIPHRNADPSFTVAPVYTTEFQKRGLPHAHICLFIHPDNKIHNPSDIDKFISSEIPDKFTEPELYQLLSDHMLHGPCGEANPSCSCMIDRECSKNFPKGFQSETSIDSKGFLVYKRRDNGCYVVKNGINLDNRSVVPYNKQLLRKYQAHINVEWCNQEGSSKYLFKYINKGPDRATISFVQNNSPDNEDPNADEIKAFYYCRYLSAWSQQVIYGTGEDIEDVLTKPSNATLMFIGWMEADKNYRHARKLSYAKFPTQDACYRRGLLDDDKEYIEAIEEASHTANGYYLRNLFATMLITFSLSRTDYVWDNTWHFLVDGILYYQQKKHKNPGLSLSDEKLKNLALLEIEEFLVSNNSSLRRFSHMPFPDQEFISASLNPLMMEELAYDTDALTNDFKNLYISLTSEQKGVYNGIFNSWKRKKGGVFFIYGYRGTGKTYLWKTLSTSIWSKGEIVLNVASSGIASLLLEGGRTAHSRFLIPINLTKDSQYQVKGNTDVSDLLKKTSLIIWDEAPMTHKHAFEALDRTLKDVMKGYLANTYESLFGGKVVVLGGDFRQILPVVQNRTRNECVNATISSSYICSKCNLGGQNDGEETISIPDDLLIKHSLDHMSDLIDFVYPSMLERFNDLTYFQERALLAPLNEVVQEINDRMLSYFPGQEMEFLSSGSIDEVESVLEGF